MAWKDGSTMGLLTQDMKAKETVISCGIWAVEFDTIWRGYNETYPHGRRQWGGGGEVKHLHPQRDFFVKKNKIKKKERNISNVNPKT
jgi:hypothetical protein